MGWPHYRHKKAAEISGLTYILGGGGVRIPDFLTNPIKNIKLLFILNNTSQSVQRLPIKSSLSQCKGVGQSVGQTVIDLAFIRQPYRERHRRG
jgi:hypothetical protein